MILQKMKKDKNFHKWLVANNQNRIERYYIETILESYKTKRPLDELQEFISKKRTFMLEKDFKPLKAVFKGKTLERFFDYIEKQDIEIRTYLDYFILKNLIVMLFYKNVLCYEWCYEFVQKMAKNSC